LTTQTWAPHTLERVDFGRALWGIADIGHLNSASLVGAHLEGAILHGAHLEGADLRDTHLERAFADKSTGWPEGFDWRAAGVVAMDGDAQASSP